MLKLETRLLMVAETLELNGNVIDDIMHQELNGESFAYGDLKLSLSHLDKAIQYIESSTLALD